MINWRTNVEADALMVESLVGKLRADAYKSREGFYTSYWEPNVLERPEVTFAPLYKGIIGQCMSHLGLQDRMSYSFDHWAQLYDSADGGHLVHDHYAPAVIASWVHFVQPASTSKFHFFRGDGSKVYPKQKKGDFIVFDSWRLHAVDPTNEGEDRLVIAGNVYANDVYSPNAYDDTVNRITFKNIYEAQETHPQNHLDWSKYL